MEEAVRKVATLEQAGQEVIRRDVRKGEREDESLQSECHPTTNKNIIQQI
jgi:hypothetical protein